MKNVGGFLGDKVALAKDQPVFQQIFNPAPLSGKEKILFAPPPINNDHQCFHFEENFLPKGVGCPPAMPMVALYTSRISKTIELYP